MDRAYVRSLSQTHAEIICKALASQQHLHPHRALATAVAEAGRIVGFCSGAAEQAIRWLQADPARSIGRMRRTELMQLARSIDRFWQQATEGAETKAQSA